MDVTLPVEMHLHVDLAVSQVSEVRRIPRTLCPVRREQLYVPRNEEVVVLSV